MGTNGDRRPSSPVLQVLVVWLLAVLPQSVRVVGHGPDGRSAALAVAVLGLLAVCCVLVQGPTVVARTGSLLVVGVVGLVVTGPLVGRVPWCLCVASLLVVAAAVVVPAPTALVLSAVPAVVWPLTGNAVVVAPLWLLVAVVVALSAGTEVLGPVDAAVAGGVARSRPVVARRTSPVARWWRDPETGPARWAGAVGALLSLPVLWRLTEGASLLVRGTNDYSQHVERALAITFSPFFSSVPHPVWHLLFRLLDPVLGARVTVVVIGMAAAGATVAVLVTVGRSAWDDLPPLGPRLAAAYGLGYLLMENVGQFVPRGDAWWNRLDVAGLRARGPSFWPLHQWGSPTMTLSLPLVLLMVATLLFSLRGDLERARRHRVALAVLTVAATMTLPAATLALVPATVLYVLLTRRWDRARLAVVVPYFLVPGTLVCIVQTVFLASGVSAFERTTWRWHPFWNVRYIGFDRPAFWLLFLVAPAAWWLCGRRWSHDPMVLLSLLAVVVALFPAFLLQQTEPEKMMDGDLIMPAFFAVVLFVMASVRLVLVELQSVWEDRGRRPVPPAAVVAALLLGLMVCSGVLDLLGAAGVVPEL